MSDKDDGGPAFPSKFDIKGPNFNPVNGKNVPEGQTESYIQLGMSWRDYCAIKVMQARLSRQPDPLPAPQWFSPGHEVEDALLCYAIADAMLAARSK